MFIDQVFQHIEQKFQGELGNLTISDVRIGAFLGAVKLSDGSYGIASAIKDSDIHCDKKERDFGDFTPLQIVGLKVSTLFAHEKNTATVQILKIAALNAFFHRFVKDNSYKILRNTDPIDILDLNKYKNVAMVGAFHSYINKLSKFNNNLQVLELNKDAFLPHHAQYYVSAEKYKEVISNADLVIITGLTLVNNTFDNLLSAISPNSKSIVIGPSSGIIPDLFFEKQIDIIGGTLITNPEKLFPMVSQGAAGYHLFKYCAEKICVLNE